LSWTDWTSGEWLGKLVPQWSPSAARLPEAIAESMSRLVDVFGFSPASFLHDLVTASSAGLIGRELETTIGGDDVHFVLEVLRVAPPQYGPLVGQFGIIDVQVRNLVWRDRRIARLRVRAENVHVQPGVPSTLVAAPVRLTASIDQAHIAALVGETRPGLVITLAAGVASVALEGRECWGRLEVALTLRGDTVRLKPAAVVLRDRRLERLGRVIPAAELRLPPAPRNARYAGIRVDGDQLCLDVVVDEWREPLQPSQLQDLDRRLRRSEGGVLRLPRAKPNSTQ
jgi:hypothetical protein